MNEEKITTSANKKLSPEEIKGGKRSWMPSGQTI